MNKLYMNVEGTVGIYNNNLQCKTRKYCDNLEEILVKENLIEEMETRLKKCSKAMVALSTGKKISTDTMSKLIGILYGICMLLLGIVAFIAPHIAIAGTIIATLSCVAGELLTYKKFKDNIKNHKALCDTYKFLSQELKKERANLEQLEKRKVILRQKYYDNNLQLQKVNDSYEIRDLNREIENIRNNTTVEIEKPMEFVKSLGSMLKRKIG
ncbi:MAG: DUF308 domain-containing protein [Bacilli bacterium]|nr:DUF308 domain-containing protein [Bacilli bacterium]